MHFSACTAGGARSDTLILWSKAAEALSTCVRPPYQRSRGSRMIGMRCHKQKPQLVVAAGALFAIAVSSALAPLAQAAQPYTADAMWKLKRLGDPAISPDGRLAVVPVTKYDIEKNKGDADLWLVPTKPGKARQLTSDAGSDATPAWSPDGELIAFVSKRGEDKQAQLYVIAV